jgi:hypothetical protein
MPVWGVWSSILGRHQLNAEFSTRWLLPRTLVNKRKKKGRGVLSSFKVKIYRVPVAVKHPWPLCVAVRIRQGRVTSSGEQSFY